MKAKFFAVVALLFALAVSGFAGEFVRIDLNFWGSDAAIVPVGKLPDGVRMLKKVPFNNKKLYGFATPLIVDLGKVRSLDLKFSIQGKAGKIVPSLQSCRGDDGKFPEIECLEFEFNGDASTKMPMKFSKWTNSGVNAEVEDGDTVTLKAEFKTDAAAADVK